MYMFFCLVKGCEVIHSSVSGKPDAANPCACILSYCLCAFAYLVYFFSGFLGILNDGL